MSNEYNFSDQPSGDSQSTGNFPQQSAAPTYTETSQNGSYRYTSGNIPGQSEYGSYQATPQSGDAVPPYQAHAQQNAYYQDQAGGYQPPAPPTGSTMSGYNVNPPQPKKQPKRSGGRGTIVAVAIICALVGGLGGGAAVGMALSSSTAAEPSVSAEEAESSVIQEETSEVTEEESTASISTTVVDITTNSSSTEMTPQSVYDTYVNAVVAISNESTTTNVMGQTSSTASSGSGFIISTDGYIITNNHVVEDATTLTVIMTSGEEYEATIIGADEESDVALIKIDASDLPTVSIGDSDEIAVGEQVCAIGNPLGELTNTLTVGYISALDREIYESSSSTPINMFQTDCAINSGNSGGPLFDMHGNVIGITTAKYSSSSSSSASIEGIGFCIPINDAMEVVSDLLEYGYVRGRAYLGITCQAISTTVTQYYNLPAGIYVNSVESGAAAENCGIEAGDIITAVDGTEVSSVTDFKALLKNYSAGESAVMTVYRSGATMEITVIFDEKIEATTEENAEDDTEENTDSQQDAGQSIPSMPGSGGSNSTTPFN